MCFLTRVYLRLIGERTGRKLCKVHDYDGALELLRGP